MVNYVPPKLLLSIFKKKSGALDSRNLAGTAGIGSDSAGESLPIVIIKKNRLLLGTECFRGT
jgi:hypothetical protein